MIKQEIVTAFTSAGLKTSEYEVNDIAGLVSAYLILEIPRTPKRQVISKVNF